MPSKYFAGFSCGVGLIVCATLLLAPSRSQQLQAPTTLLPTVPEAKTTTPIAVLDKAALQQDTALQAKISLEAKRMPLSELLALAQKQSGIEFKATADSPATRALMTARLKEVSLATLMLSLARIYDVRWSKNGAAYTMHGSANDELSYGLIRYQGQNRNLTVPPEERKIRDQEGDTLANDIFRSLDRKIWDDKDTVLVSSLPEALQARLRQRFELQGQEREIILERLERNYATQRIVMRLHVGEERTPMFRLRSTANRELDHSIRFKMARLMAYTSDGRFVAALFPEFHGPKHPWFLPQHPQSIPADPQQKLQPPDIVPPAPA